MITIFDLDYTLLDTISFKKELAGILAMSVEEFDESYRKYFKEKGENYNIEDHLDKIGVENKEEILEKFKKEMVDISKHLSENALEAVLNERVLSNKLVLLTFGNEDWQKEKVSRLKTIRDLFDEVVYESKEKENSLFLKSLPRDSEIKIINDNFQETEKMVREIANNRDGDESCIEVIIIKGPYSVESEELKAEIQAKGWRYCESIGELNQENQEVEQERKFAIR